jgi:hypothetical protein
LAYVAKRSSSLVWIFLKQTHCISLPEAALTLPSAWKTGGKEGAMEEAFLRGKGVLLTGR